ncbi:hypothetical protein KIL84_004226 [Mauremys mutica]|uniref:Uncharacterized protein n=1 Tax=Mauremys mutica TaxID=74926 RepID=A0A9D3XLD3_9SAUR|nr:hypothetical protein KIL84_004226 [Mauremys mutica]
MLCRAGYQTSRMDWCALPHSKLKKIKALRRVDGFRLKSIRFSRVNHSPPGETKHFLSLLGGKEVQKRSSVHFTAGKLENTAAFLCLTARSQGSFSYQQRFCLRVLSRCPQPGPANAGLSVCRCALPQR